MVQLKKIPLFNIPSHKIDTSKFNNLLHGKIVQEFEEEFANYVGAKYSVSLNSATSAIQCIFSDFYKKELGEIDNVIKVPNLIPPVVVNALINSGNVVELTDNYWWVGSWYYLHRFKNFSVIDSAQAVDKNQFQEEEYENEDLVLYSMFPSKPVGGCDGSVVVSNDKNKIDLLRKMVNNGTDSKSNSWENSVLFPGFKAYMNSFQAEFALKSLQKLDKKKEKLIPIRYKYDKELPPEVHLNRDYDSDHLYRIKIRNRSSFLLNMKSAGIECGIHYRPFNQLIKNNPYYKDKIKRINQYYEFISLKNTESQGEICVSIPFHEKLTKSEINKIINQVNKNITTDQSFCTLYSPTQDIISN